MRFFLSTRTGFITCFLIALGLSAISQGLNIELTFTAVNDTTYARLDSIRVINKSVPKETMLYYPDTVLTILNVGITENQGKNDFLLFQNYPNPCIDNTVIRFYIPERNDVYYHLADISGRRAQSETFPAGCINFHFILEIVLFICSVSVIKGSRKALKLSIFILADRKFAN